MIELPVSEFKRRRKQLMRMMGDNAIAVVPAAPVRLRNNDVEYPYRQDSDFLYLTGFTEPEAVLVLVPGRAHGEIILFCRERNAEMETWHGRRAGQEGAVEQYGADDAFPIDDIDDILPGLLEDRKAVYYTIGKDTQFDQQLMDWVNHLRKQARSGAHPPHEFINLDYLLHDMRLYKSRSEMRLMRHAAKITVAAHKRAMQICKPGMYEYEIEAEYLHTFRQANAEPAYSSIVGGGENGCILHYVENNAVLNDGDLVLIDAGAEYGGYASDVTRTFPINGRFSKPQRALYEVVLAAQKAAIKKIKPGNHWNDPHNAAIRVLTKGLIELGLLKGTLTKLIKADAYRKFYMHRTGHWLGLDVHDVGDYKIDGHWRLLESGMVMTVEPGLYIAPDAKGVTKRWKGIGIRIEDDVLVTKDGHEVLTAAITNDPDEIEALMNA